MHKRLLLVLLVSSLILHPSSFCQAQFRELGVEYQRGNPQFVAAFREVVAGPSKSTVRILCDGQETALGMVVAPNGWILTKAADLHGHISCRFRDGRSVDARWIGVHHGHDLAMLQVPLRGLTPVEFRPSKTLSVGSWVVSPGLGDDPVGMGIVSVPTRTVAAKYLGNDAYLGISIDEEMGGIRVTQVVADTPAARAGFKAQDVILALGNKRIVGSDDFLEMMRQRSVGDSIALTVRRDKETLLIQATLARRPHNTRGDSQNAMGSELSSRTSGYATILQHDAVLRPKDCGGPIVDLDGMVVGINICRAGRTESWAIPSEVVQPLLPSLMAGR